MSDITKAALEDALAAHIADEREGFMVGDYVLKSHIVSIEEDAGRSFYHFMHSAMPYHSVLGLLESALADYVDAANGDEDDDD
jgi:hypothetical protein